MAKKKRTTELDALFAIVDREAKERKATGRWSDKAAHLRDLLMAAQRHLEQDPSKRKAVRSPRQTGKSTGVMLIVSIRCLEKELAEWVVVCVTRGSARAIYWEPLKQLNKAYELGITFQSQAMEATFSNGSKVRFIGADNISEIEKLRGGRYNGVVIDESKSYPILLLDELIHEVIEPALIAKNGELFIIGTPGDSLRGTFYLATVDEPVLFPGPDGKTPERQSNCLYGTLPQYPAKWSFHRWTSQDNTTRFPDGNGGWYTIWDKVQVIMRENGWTRSTPQAAREYFGDWVPADDKRVYRYRPQLHDYDSRPDKASHLRHRQWGLPDVRGEYKTVLGYDLGTRDGTCAVVWAWNVHTDDLWEVYSEKRVKQVGERFPLSELATWYHDLELTYGPFDVATADAGGLGVLALDTLADDHQVYLEPADKQEKNDAIEVMNDDFDRGRIHIRRNSLLSEELDADRWDLKKLDKNKKVEDATIPNDAADAGLYGHRMARHRKPTARTKDGALPFTPEWFRQRADVEMQAHKDAAKREAEARPDQNQFSAGLFAAMGLQPTLDKEWW